MSFVVNNGGILTDTTGFPAPDDPSLCPCCGLMPPCGTPRDLILLNEPFNDNSNGWTLGANWTITGGKAVLDERGALSDGLLDSPALSFDTNYESVMQIEATVSETTPVLGHITFQLFNVGLVGQGIRYVTGGTNPIWIYMDALNQVYQLGSSASGDTLLATYTVTGPFAPRSFLNFTIWVLPVRIQILINGVHRSTFDEWLLYAYYFDGIDETLCSFQSRIVGRRASFSTPSPGTYELNVDDYRYEVDP